MTKEMAQALAGWAFAKGLAILGAALLVAFQGLLRTGELLALRRKDVTVNADNSRAILDLGLTKGGARRGHVESVVIDDVMLVRLLCAVTHSLAAHELLVPSQSRFRAAFAEGVEALGYSSATFKPYALRRGGATHLYQESLNWSCVMHRGRWANQTTVRNYVNEGLAERNRAEMTAK